ncbi:MAG: hypothetical protein ABJG42_24335 [Vibrio splendidus]
MNQFEFVAFLHPVSSNSQGFLYLKMTTSVAIHHIRVSSADELGLVSVAMFDDVQALKDEAATQSRFNPCMVINDDLAIASIFLSDTNQKMLEASIAEAAPELFNPCEGIYFAQANA